MDKLLKRTEKDLEYILTEWEGKSNPLMGAFRVKARMDKIMPLFTALLAEIEKEIGKVEVEYAHTYASENADIYRAHDAGQEEMKARILALLRPSEPKGEEKP